MVLTEKENIQSLIDAKKIKISNLASQKERLVSQLQDLTLLREAEIQELAALQMMMSPIGKLPTELLGEIFYFHVPVEAFWEEGTIHIAHIIVSALAISHVCRHWRKISHEMPQLWVHGFQFNISRKATDLEFAQTKAWLERSQPLLTFVMAGLPRANPSKAPIFPTSLCPPHTGGGISFGMHLPLTKLPPGSLYALENFTMEDLDFIPPERPVDAVYSN
ncbi:hypothetical protein B0H11DRAFT_1220002 [Mycena galericulata]|nr:hypothetical protein B0H11DRAFT_598902 [Mycena galericulata]KAJ7482392.1 hypothetical protein B0H11DRAFT_1220002 [Mycena galericulata]